MNHMFDDTTSMPQNFKPKGSILDEEWQERQRKKLDKEEGEDEVKRRRKDVLTSNTEQVVKTGEKKVMYSIGGDERLQGQTLLCVH